MIQEWGLERVFVCCVQRPSGGNSMGGQGSGCHRQEAGGRHQPPGIRCAFADAPITHWTPLPPALHSGKMYHRRVPWKVSLMPCMQCILPFQVIAAWQACVTCYVLLCRARQHPRRLLH